MAQEMDPEQHGRGIDIEAARSLPRSQIGFQQPRDPQRPQVDRAACRLQSWPHVVGNEPEEVIGRRPAAGGRPRRSSAMKRAAEPTIGRPLRQRRNCHNDRRIKRQSKSRNFCTILQYLTANSSRPAHHLVPSRLFVRPDLKNSRLESKRLRTMH